MWGFWVGKRAWESGALRGGVREEGQAQRHGRGWARKAVGRSQVPGSAGLRPWGQGCERQKESLDPHSPDP